MLLLLLLLLALLQEYYANTGALVAAAKNARKGKAVGCRCDCGALRRQQLRCVASCVCAAALVAEQHVEDSLFGAGVVSCTA
jgi:hypothetical protein